MYTALRAASRTFASYLFGTISSEPELAPLFDPSLGGTMVVSTNSPDEMSEAGTQGVSLWLYKVDRDEQRINDLPTRPSVNQLQKAPVPLKLHYLITPVFALDSSNPLVSSELRQVLAGKILQTFHDHPVFRGADLLDSLAGSEASIAMRLENFSMDDFSRIWSGQKNSYQLSLAYEAGVVFVDSAQQPRTISPVAIFEPVYGQILERRPKE